jgi:hypothetical protein
MWTTRYYAITIQLTVDDDVNIPQLQNAVEIQKTVDGWLIDKLNEIDNNWPEAAVTVDVMVEEVKDEKAEDEEVASAPPELVAQDHEQKEVIH